MQQHISPTIEEEIAPPLPELFPGQAEFRAELDAEIAKLTERDRGLRERALGVRARPTQQPPVTGEPGLGFVNTLKVFGASALRNLSLGATTIRDPALAVELRRTPPFIPEIKTPEWLAELARNEAALRNEAREVALNLARLDWRRYVLEAVPHEIADPEAPLRNVSQLIERFAGDFLESEDVQWAGRVLDAALRAQESQARPHLSPDEIQEIADRITQRRSVTSLYGALFVGGIGLMEALQASIRPRDLKGLTPADIRAVFSEAGFEDEALDKQVKARRSYLVQLRSAWGEAEAQHAMLLSDLAYIPLADLQRLINERVLSGLIDRPMAAAMLPMSYLRRRVTQPLAGALTAGILYAPRKEIGLPWLEPVASALGYTPKREEQFAILFEQAWRRGAGPADALGYAFRNSDLPAFQKFVNEVLADPLTYWGFGLYAKVLKPLPLIGGRLAGVELGYTKAVDAAFLGMARKIYQATPKTLGQRVKVATAEATDRIWTAVTQDQMLESGRLLLLENMPVEKVKSSLIRIAGFAKENPGDSTDRAIAGRYLRARPPLREREFISIYGAARRALPEAPAEELSSQVLADVNRKLGLMENFGGKALNVDEAAELVFKSLRLADDTASSGYNAVRAELVRLEEAFDAGLEAAIKGPDTVRRLFNTINGRIQQTALDTMSSPAFRENTRIAALSGAASTLGGDFIAIWANHLDNFSRGFARMYLMFANYSPYNVLENAYKTLNAHLNPVYEGDRVQALLRLTLGLHGVDPMYVRAGGATLELGEIAKAGDEITSTFGGLVARTVRLRPARPQMLSPRTYRRLARRRRSLWSSFWQGLDDILIKSGGRFGLQQQANYLYQAMERQLYQADPVALGALESLIDDAADALRSAGFGEREVKWLKKEAWTRGATLPESLRGLALDFTPDRVFAADLRALVARYPDLGPVVAEHLYAMIGSRQLIAQLTRIFDEEVPELIAQSVLQRPDLARTRLITLIDELRANPPKTFTELNQRVRDLQFLGNDVSEVISTQTQATSNYFRELGHAMDLDVKEAYFREMWDEVLIPFMQEAEERITAYADDLRRAIRRTDLKLSPDQQAVYNDLIEAVVNHAALVRNAWREQRAITERLIAERRGIINTIRSEGKSVASDPRMEAWWDSFYREREASWGIHRQLILDANAQKIELGLRSSGREPNLIFPVVDRPLTVSDIAEMYRSVPLDLTRGLFMPEFGAFQSRVSWVDQVYARASTLARRTGQTADDMGYSKEALGRVYDDMIREMLGRPEVSSVYEPLLAQARALKAEVVHYARRKSALFPKGRQEAIERFGEEVYQAMRRDPQTGAAFFEHSPERLHQRLQMEIVREFQPIARGVEKPVTWSWEDYREAIRSYLLPAERELTPVPPRAWAAAQHRLNLALMSQGHTHVMSESGELIPLAQLSKLSHSFADLPDRLITPLTELDLAVEQGRFPEMAGVPPDQIEEFMKVMSDWMRWLGGADAAVARDRVGRIASSPAFAPYRKRLREILRLELGDRPIVFRGARAEAGSLSEPAGEYISVTTDYTVAKEFGDEFTVDVAQIDLDDVVAVASVWESELIVKSSAFRGRRVSLPADVQFAPSTTWQGTRQAAFDAAKNEFRLDFPNYSVENETAFNSAARAVFPFWTYETHRLFWLARTYIRTPGVFDTQAKYQDYSDQGYLRVPFFDWEISPLRGTIFMGGMRRLIQRDFPEYYDQFPNLANAFDEVSRFGFYPNIFITATLALAGGRRSQIGEVLPPIVQAPLETYIAAQPDSRLARNLLETLLPNRFRDYVVAQAVGKLGGPGLDILNKRVTQTELTDEEEAWWAKGQREISQFNLINMNLGLLRFRPEERVEFEKQSLELLEELTGVPVAMQEQMRRAGMRLGEVVWIRPEVKDLVRELEGFTRWRGLASHLRESEVGYNLALTRQFWTEVRDDSEGLYLDQLDSDHRWQRGEITYARWDFERADRARRLRAIVDSKREDPRYRMELDGKEFMVPMTLEEREEFYSAHGMDPVLMHPEEELESMWYQVELHDTINEAGKVVKDWDRFWLERKLIEEALPEAGARRIKDRVAGRMTPLEQANRRDYEEYIRPYRAAHDVVLASLSDEDRRVVEEYFGLGDEFSERKEELRGVVGPDGRKVIASFLEARSDLRERMRILDPELDARLALWEGLAPKTDEAREAWRRLRSRYGFVEVEQE